MRKNAIVAMLVGTTLLLAASGTVSAATFTLIARQSQGAVQSIRRAVLPAINDSGTVLFSATDTSGSECLFKGQGGALVQTTLSATHIGSVRGVAIDTAGNQAFSADHIISTTDHRLGVYSAPPGGGTAIGTLYEQDNNGLVAPRPLLSNIAMSPNGTVAFSAVVDGTGAVMRGSVTGGVSALYHASFTFYNATKLSVLDSGRVAVLVEYGGNPPPQGLRRGIFLIDGQDQPLSTTQVAYKDGDVGVDPPPVFDPAGNVVLVLSRTPTTTLLTNPAVSFTPGIYIAHPAPFSAATPSLAKIVERQGFASIGRALPDGKGRVFFEVTLADGTTEILGRDNQGRGGFIFVARTNDALNGPKPFISLQLGGVNSAGQIVFHAVDKATVHDEIWRVTF